MSNFFLHLVSESNITSYGCSFIRFKVSSVSVYFKSSPKHLTLQYNRLILAGLGRGLGAGFGFAVWKNRSGRDRHPCIQPKRADTADVEQITTRDAIAERFPAAGKIEHRRSPRHV